MGDEVDKIIKTIALAESLQTTHVTSDSRAAEIIDDLADGVLAMQESIKTLLENNERLVKAINEAPEFERAVKASSSVELVQLRAALVEACGIAHRWVDSKQDSDRIYELLKLTADE